MSLPYDATPPPSPPRTKEPSALDRPLDDYAPAIPQHVASLMSRMGKGKVYLLEESPAILHVDVDQRAARDPRVLALAAQLDEQDPLPWLMAVSETAFTPVRPNALYLISDLIKHLSTSKVFSWATSLGIKVMGIEWLNDTTLHLLFPSPKEALLALSLLSKAGFDPSEGDDPLLERAAHSFPISLLPTAPVPSLADTELLPAQPSEPGIRRKGRGAFTNGEPGVFDLPPLVPADHGFDDWNLAEGVDPNARIGVRYGLEGDMALRGSAKGSEWYRRNGRQAGKEVAAGRRSLGGAGDRDDGLSWKNAGGSGEGREFAKRLGRAKGPYERGEGREGRREGRRGRGRTTEDLDRELDGIRGGDAGLDADGDVDMEGGEADTRRRRGNDNGRRGERKKDDLDKELDDMFASRTTTST